MGHDIENLYRSLVTKPADADVLHQFGEALAARGDLNAALYYFAQALSANPRHLPAARSHQITLERLGLKEKLYTNRFMLFYFTGRPYYMPIPDEGWIDSHLDTLFDLSTDQYQAIDINPEGQLRLLDELAVFHKDIPFADGQERGRYKRDNHQFFEMDAAVLYCMMRLKKPARVIEIGSGHSSAVMLDANDELAKTGAGCYFTFVDPDCSRLKPLLPAPAHGIQVIEDLLQNVDPKLFDELSAGDILFIDSSHVLKTGSDVNLLISSILPRLKHGVIIHFHDIFHNFEYPRVWLQQFYPWNEAYTLRHFLMYNQAFKVLFFNSWIVHRHSDVVFDRLPIVRAQWEGGRWIEKSWRGKKETAEKAWIGGSLWLVKNGA